MKLCEKLLQNDEVTSSFMQAFRGKLHMIRLGQLMVTHNLKNVGDEFLRKIEAVYKAGDWNLGELHFKYDANKEMFELTEMEGIFMIPENTTATQKHINQLLMYLNKNAKKSSDRTQRRVA